jgi:ArsR family transcriptional regulator
MEAKELRAVLRAMADVARIRMVRHLASGDEVTVSALTRALRISQPLASWHLRTLRKAGLITTRRVGREVHCTLNRCRLEECIKAIGDLAAPAGPEERV